MIFLYQSIKFEDKFQIYIKQIDFDLKIQKLRDVFAFSEVAK